MGHWIVDKDTGQVLDELKPGDRILRAESIAAHRKFEGNHESNNDAVEYFELENFFKGHSAEIQKLMNDLSTNERSFLFSVAPYVGYEDCCLKHSNGKELDTEALEAITGFSPRVLYRTLNDLIKKDIIYKGKNSYSRQYFVNPWIFCKGQRINKVLKTMFGNYQIRCCKNVKWKLLK